MINTGVPLRLILAAKLVLLSGCVTPPRADPPASPAAAMVSGFPRSVRLDAGDPEVSSAVAKMMARASASADSSFDILSLSGGGAHGAFGAGSLVGLTRAGKRPRFEIVTGVSAGALIAPFAFLGADWDEQMAAAFTGQQSGKLIRPRALGALFSPGLFSVKPLRERVDQFITPGLWRRSRASRDRGASCWCKRQISTRSPRSCGT